MHRTRRPRQRTARQISLINSLQSRGTAPCTTAAHDSAAVRPSAVAVIAGWHSERTAVSFAMARASSADASWRSTTHPLSASLSTLNRQAEPTDRRPLVLAPFHPVSLSGSFSQPPRQPGQDMQADDQLTGLGLQVLDGLLMMQGPPRLVELLHRSAIDLVVPDGMVQRDWAVRAVRFSHPAARNDADGHEGNPVGGRRDATWWPALHALRRFTDKGLGLQRITGSCVFT